MPRKSASPHPIVRRLLKELGENIHLARLRRGFSMALIAERAGMSRPTLRAVERGEPGVTLEDPRTWVDVVSAGAAHRVASPPADIPALRDFPSLPSVG